MVEQAHEIPFRAHLVAPKVCEVTLDADYFELLALVFKHFVELKSFHTILLVRAQLLIVLFYRLVDLVI